MPVPSSATTPRVGIIIKISWLIAGILCLSAGSAWAHAIIVESFPEINGVVTGPVLVVKLRFNSRIDGSLSKLSLTYPDGSSRAVHLLEQKAPDWLFAKATDLLPGMYQLRWQVLASDGHITQGTIPFTVV